MIGEMKSMSNDITGPGDPRVIGLGIAAFVVMMTGLYVAFEIFGNNTPSPIETLTANCEAADGVIIQGLTQNGDAYQNFAVCVPYEALTCIDVE